MMWAVFLRILMSSDFFDAIVPVLAAAGTTDKQLAEDLVRCQLFRGAGDAAFFLILAQFNPQQVRLALISLVESLFPTPTSNEPIAWHSSATPNPQLERALEMIGACLDMARLDWLSVDLFDRVRLHLHFHPAEQSAPILGLLSRFLSFINDRLQNSASSSLQQEDIITFEPARLVSWSGALLTDGMTVMIRPHQCTPLELPEATATLLLLEIERHQAILHRRAITSRPEPWWLVPWPSNPCRERDVSPPPALPPSVEIDRQFVTLSPLLMEHTFMSRARISWVEPIGNFRLSTTATGSVDIHFQSSVPLQIDSISAKTYDGSDNNGVEGMLLFGFDHLPSEVELSQLSAWDDYSLQAALSWKPEVPPVTHHADVSDERSLYRFHQFKKGQLLLVPDTDPAFMGKYSVAKVKDVDPAGGFVHVQPLSENDSSFWAPFWWNGFKPLSLLDQAVSVWTPDDYVQPAPNATGFSIRHYLRQKRKHPVPLSAFPDTVTIGWTELEDGLNIDDSDYNYGTSGQHVLERLRIPPPKPPPQRSCFIPCAGFEFPVHDRPAAPGYVTPMAFIGFLNDKLKRREAVTLALPESAVGSTHFVLKLCNPFGQSKSAVKMRLKSLSLHGNACYARLRPGSGPLQVSGLEIPGSRDPDAGFVIAACFKLSATNNSQSASLRSVPICHLTPLSDDTSESPASPGSPSSSTRGASRGVWRSGRQNPSHGFSRNAYQIQPRRPIPTSAAAQGPAKGGIQVVASNLPSSMWHHYVLLVCKISSYSWTSHDQRRRPLTAALQQSLIRCISTGCRVQSLDFLGTAQFAAQFVFRPLNPALRESLSKMDSSINPVASTLRFSILAPLPSPLHVAVMTLGRFAEGPGDPLAREMVRLFDHKTIGTPRIPVSEFWSQVTEADKDVRQYPLLHASSTDELLSRSFLLDDLHHALLACLPVFGTQNDNGSSHVASLLIRLREMFYLSGKVIFLRMAPAVDPSCNNGTALQLVRPSRAPGAGPLHKESIFYQVFQQLRSVPISHFLLTRCLWKVEYIGETGIDMGGVYRDSLRAIGESLSMGDCGLFVPSPNSVHHVGDNRELIVPSTASMTEEMRALFSLVGTLLGLCIMDQFSLDLRFPSFFWKYLVGDPSSGFTQADLSEIDMLAAQQLDQDCPASSVACCFEPYLPAMEAIRTGLNRLFSRQAFALLTPGQAEQLMSPPPLIDIDVLQHTVTISDSDGEFLSSRLISDFFDVLREFSPALRKQFLVFAWGHSILPFPSSPHFKPMELIPLDLPSPDTQLVRAATCFFTVKLPRYSSKEILRERLLYSMTQCSSIDGD